MITVILTESTPQQALFRDPIWVIKDWKSQLRWISVILRQEKDVARTGIKPATQGFSVL